MEGDTSGGNVVVGMPVETDMEKGGMYGPGWRALTAKVVTRDVEGGSRIEICILVTPTQQQTSPRRSHDTLLTSMLYSMMNDTRPSIRPASCLPPSLRYSHGSGRSQNCPQRDPARPVSVHHCTRPAPTTASSASANSRTTSRALP